MTERKFKTVVTRVGKEKAMEAAVTGRKVPVTTAVVGDGGGSYYVPEESMTAIRNEVWRGQIAGMEINRKSPNMLDVKVVLPGTVGGFTVRECGIMDEDGDLIAVCNLPDTEKAVIEEGVTEPLTILMHIVLTDGDSLEFMVDPSIDTATAASQSVTIPAESWEEDGEAGEEYPYKADVESYAVTALHYPFVALDVESLGIAGDCELCPTVESMSGALRFRAKKKPEGDMRGTVLLVTQGGGAGGAGGGTGSDYILPTATAFRLGGVKVGNGLVVAQDGTVSVNQDKVMTDADLVDEDEVRKSVASILKTEDEA
ncbi:MAG: phage tail protein [Muribaculaceae bacterium]|nr:phage tail protein [Muribaculaceae bacterium]